MSVVSEGTGPRIMPAGVPAVPVGRAGGYRVQQLPLGRPDQGNAMKEAVPPAEAGV